MNEYLQQLAAKNKTPRERQVDVKIYFHHHNHAKFHFDLGKPGQVKTVEFSGYKYITDDKLEQDQLDLICNVPGSFVYSAPDSEAARAIMQELQQQQSLDLQHASRAAAAVSNTQYDPNTPIVPVNMAMQPTHVGIVGMQNSFSGGQATDQINANLPAQTAPPTALTTAQLNPGIKTMTAAEMIAADARAKLTALNPGTNTE